MKKNKTGGRKYVTQHIRLKRFASDANEKIEKNIVRQQYQPRYCFLQSSISSDINTTICHNVGIGRQEGLKIL